MAGQRSGRWLSVHRNGQKRSEGHYHANAPYGEWRYYYDTGQLATVESEYRGQASVLVSYKEDGSRNAEAVSPRQPPVFPGGETALMSYLVRNTVYPREARRKGITGKVYVRYTVDEAGRVGQVYVVRGLAPDIDTEARRVVSSLPRFIPGREYNVPTAFTYTVPIYFAPNFSLFGGPKPPQAPPIEARANW